MSDTDLVAGVAARLFTQSCPPEVVAAAEGSWAPSVWSALEEAELTRIGVPVDAGGPGGGWPEAAAVLRAAARYAAPVPLAETGILAGVLLATAGIPVPSGPLTVAHGAGLVASRVEGRWTISGAAERVAWSRQASTIVAVARAKDRAVVACVSPSACRIEDGLNLAREPRDRVTLAAAPAVDVPLAAETDLLLRGALARAIQLSGALERVLELTVAHVRVREQFGRPLGQLQAVQQEVARLAGESAAARAAVEAALDATDDEAAIACAKVRAGLAAAESARIAHQLHGAIGVTYEHQLHHFTSRLSSWRDEYGGEREWSVRLGRLTGARGAAGYWSWLVR